MIVIITYATKRIVTWILWGTVLVAAPSVRAHESGKEMDAFMTHVQPKIDGALDDECWETATPSTGFILMEPHEGVAATNQTFIRVLYDTDYLYIGLDMIDEEPSNIEGRMVQRDGVFAPLDLVGLVLDTYHDHQSAYGFYINTYGIQNDFRVENDGAGGWGGIDSNWDGVWQSETHLHDGGWSAEIVIPFNTLRFPESEHHTWGLNVQRIARTYTEDSNWSFISRDVGYLLKVSKAGHLHGIGRIKQGLHLETRPYATGRYEKLRNQPTEGWTSNFGLDLKYGIASNLTLDATINPDFAHIEADENQINLTRFELFLREKRPFFLEGQKLFTPMDLFYSRRISDPDVGSKITGKIGKNSLGLIAARNRQADGDKPHFGVLRLKRDLGVNSSIGALAVGKDGHLGQQAVGSDLVLSLDENTQLFLSSAMSFGTDVGERNRMHTGRLTRNSDRLPFGVWASWIDPGFNVDQIGFIPHDADVGEREFGLYGSYSLRPHFLGIQKISLGQDVVAEQRTNEEGWEWQWSNVDLYAKRWDDSSAWFRHENWQLRWQQNTYKGDSFEASFDTGNGRKYRILFFGQLRDQYDFQDEYLGDIRRVAGVLQFNLWKGFFFDSSTESVWEYFPSGALDEVKRVLLLRTTYFFHRDLFVRSFFQRSFHEDTIDLNLLLSHRFGVNDSRFYIAYNEHRAKDEAVERASAPARGSNGVLVPGERECVVETRYRREGIPVEERVWRQTSAGRPRSRRRDRDVNEELQAAAEHLDAYGYCVLKDRIPREAALALGRRCLVLHSDPRCEDYIVGDEYYQTLFGMLNQDDEVWNCAFHPDTVALARHFLGPRCRVVEACSKPTWPGAPAQHLHADSAGSFAQVPDVPWMINSIWMLTDFTAANGATGVVPMSHRSRRASPPPEMGADSPLITPVEGRAGSVMLWHGGLFHQARANQSEDVRIGLNIAYYPPWFNNWIEGGHQPLWPETYERMPEDFRRLCPRLLGRRRADRYEQR